MPRPAPRSLSRWAGLTQIYTGLNADLFVEKQKKASKIVSPEGTNVSLAGGRGGHV